MLLLDVLQFFDFIFMLYMMVGILGFTNGLSITLQNRDQDLLNAFLLVNATKQEWLEIKNNGWEELISKVMKNHNKHSIDVPDMDALYVQEKKLNDMLQLLVFLVCIIISMVICLVF